MDKKTLNIINEFAERFIPYIDKLCVQDGSYLGYVLSNLNDAIEFDDKDLAISSARSLITNLDYDLQNYPKELKELNDMGKEYFNKLF